MKKVRTGYELLHKVFCSEQIMISEYNLEGKATTDHPLTIKYSRRDVDYRVKNEIRSGLWRRRK